MSNPDLMGKILIVDDDINITDLVKFNLTSEGYGVDVETSPSNVDIATLYTYRLVIVDAMNQAYNGIDFCADVKAQPQSASVPVIICTVPEGEDDVIKAFDQGADDYITKPFSLRELVARVKAVLRRHPMTSQIHHPVVQELSVPGVDIIINPDNQKVLAAGTMVSLTKTEFAILMKLFKNRNSFFTREDICRAVWPNEVTSNERIVDTNISRLRKKLGEVGKHIINRYGMGYAFVDKVQ